MTITIAGTPPSGTVGVAYSFIPTVTEQVSAGSGIVSVPAERLVTFSKTPGVTGLTGLPYGAPTWAQPFDPSEHAPFACDFSPLFDASEKIASIAAISLSASAAALGIAIDQASGYVPIIDSANGTKLQIWLKTAGALAAFAGLGVNIGVSFRIITTAAQPRTWERSGILVVRQL